MKTKYKVYSVLILAFSLAFLGWIFLNLRSGSSFKETKSFEKLPLSFIPNQGEFSSGVVFRTQLPGGTIFVTKSGITLSLISKGKGNRGTSSLGVKASDLTETNSTVLSMFFLGANPAPEITGKYLLPGTANFFIGNESKDWRTGIPTYRIIEYKQLYPGINLYYSGDKGIFKGTYQVDPGASPNSIRWKYDGSTSERVNQENESLEIEVPGMGYVLTEQSPVAWQVIDGHRKQVDVGYVVSGGNVGFQIGDYDLNSTLYIDPVLTYSTFLGGGSNLDSSNAVAIDPAGNIYLTGLTTSSDFPVTPGSYQVAHSAGSNFDAFVSKISSDGSSLLYSTYIGGSLGSGADQSRTIAVDTSGNAYIAGETNSPDYPTFNAIQPILLGGAGNVFVTKINSSGTGLIYSTFFGYSQSGAYAIALDSYNNVYITGSAYYLPITQNALQTNPGGDTDAFMAKISSDGSNLEYSTYLGGSGHEIGYGIDVSQSGLVYVAGYTASSNYPVRNPLQTYRGDRDGFISVIDIPNSQFVYSTLIGGTGGDEVRSIKVDSSDNAYLVGVTTSLDFPTTSSSFQPLFAGGDTDAFVAKIIPDGSNFGYSTYLGGNGSDIVRSIAIDSQSNLYLAGQSSSSNFPLLDSIQSAYKGNSDAIVVKLNESGSSLLFSTYLGGFLGDFANGIVLDNSLNAYVVGGASSPDFPITPCAIQINRLGLGDAFLSKLSFTNTPVGDGVSVALDGTTLAFSQVNTSGVTTVTTSTSGTQPPSGFRLGNPATYYNISTTATFTGNITICFSYDDTAFQGSESKLKLMHFNGQNWANITTSLDTTDDIICGVTTSFSDFAVMTEPTVLDLVNAVEDLNLQQGIENSLDVKLQRALDALSAASNNSNTEATNALNAFINEVEGQRGNKLTQSQADSLHAFAVNLINILQGITQF